MPFDPRIVPAEDSYPDDEQLEVLGAQLLDDARQLASVYPARPPGSVRDDVPLPGKADRQNVVVGSRSRHLFLGTAASAAMLLAVGIFWQWGNQRQTPIGENSLSPATTLQVVPEDFVTSPSLPVIIDDSPPPEYVEPIFPVGLPVVEQRLTGPEWEAVLDLLESEAGIAQSVSL